MKPHRAQQAQKRLNAMRCDCKFETIKTDGGPRGVRAAPFRLRASPSDLRSCSDVEAT